MKKYIAMACAMTCALGFTACSDDDDNNTPSNHVCDFTTSNSFSTIPGLSTLGNWTGMNCYMLSDAQGWCDISCYTRTDIDTTAISFSPDQDFVDGFYGGFCPMTSSLAGANEEFAPTASDIPSTGYVVCNDGKACRAIFTRRHFAMDMSAIGSALLCGDAEELYVCPVKTYEKLTTADGIAELGIGTKANVEIRFVVFGFVENISLSGWQNLVNMFKNSQVKDELGKGGALCSSYATLAKSDADGNWTINKDWQRIDLESIEDYYIFECGLQVLLNGEVVNTKFLQDRGTGKNGLNYCCVSKFTCESKSLW